MTSLVIPKEKSAKPCKYAFFPGEPSRMDLLREEFYNNWGTLPVFPQCRGYDECREYVASIDKARGLYERSMKHLSGLNEQFVRENNVFLFENACIREAIFLYSGDIRPKCNREPFAVMVARLVNVILSLDGVYDEEEDRIFEFGIHPADIPMSVSRINLEE